ncbi:MAG: DUF6261 family protein [Bacteroidales bacterium]|jgi:hypothetical protein|nr:DUF6261 family protein [Bacteroidales bacterium]
MKITRLYFQYLRNEAHYQFLTLVRKLFISRPEAAAIVADLLPSFNELVDLEGTLTDAVKASELTQELAEADQRMDRYIVGINTAVESALHHYDANMVKAAKAIEIRLKSFRGEIEKKPYEEESAAVHILLTDLQGAYAPQVSLLNLNGWVAELDAAHAEFDRIFDLRNLARASKPQQRLRDVRKEAEAAYRRIVERIDAYGVLNGEQNTALFVAELNEKVAYFNDHIHRRARTDLKTAAVASIPDRLFAGEPVVVLPEVVCEDKKLVFAKDYDLTYKNNEKPGTATIIIHGKGAYRGRKMATFNILEN